MGLRKWRLDLAVKGELPENLGEAAHGLLMSLPGFSAVHDQQPKPFSLFVLHRTEGSISLELNSLGNFFSPEELKALRDKRLGPARITAARASLLAEAEFRELAEAKPRRYIRLRFLSPTTFRSQGKHKLFPEPELLFGSLLARWNALSPLKLPELDFSKILVNRYSLKTQPFYMRDLTLIGFVGEVSYDLKNLTHWEKSIASALATFSRFAGVGYKTTMGMGRVDTV